MSNTMSLEIQQKALGVLTSCAALAGILGDRISSCVGLSQLHDCLVNTLAGSLHSLIELIATTDKLLLDQELDYLLYIQNTINCCERILVDIQTNLAVDTAGESVITLANDEDAQGRFEQALLSQTNILTVAQHILTRRLSKRKSATVTHVPSILAKLETACKLILDSKIFPAHDFYAPNSNPTFKLHEATKSSPSSPSYRLKCPRAGFPILETGGLGVRFRCCCEDRRHDAELAYQVSSEGSIPIEETAPGLDMIWTMFLRKEAEEVSVCLSEFQGLSLDSLALPRFVEQLRSTCTRMIRPGFDAAHIRSEVVKLSNLSVSVLRAKLHATTLIQQQRLREVEFCFGPRYTVPWEPGYLQMLHYATASKASLHGLSRSGCRSIFSDESNFSIFFSDRSPASWSPGDAPIESFNIRVSRGIEPYSVSPTEVTVTNVYCIHEGEDPASLNCAEVHFRFNNASDANSFCDSICHMKKNIFNTSLRCSLWGEETVFQQESYSLASESPEFGGAHLSLVHDTKDNDNRYRMIMTRDTSPRAVCFNLELTLFDGTDVDLTRILETQAIWTADVSDSGKIDTDQASWDQLVAIGDAGPAAAIAHMGGGTAGSKLDPSSAAEAWFVENIEELNLVIRAKAKLNEKGENYQAVKVAVIDTGLIPSHNMANKVTYRDFVAEASAAETKKKEDHSAEGNRKDELPQVLQDTSTSKHGTISVDIILRVYEEAELYIARVFVKDDAEETKEPFLMAKAIEWAVTKNVDIISISAGFKTCPLPLRDAVHTAYTSHTLIFAAASNWGNNDLVAFPARIRDQVFCIFATDPMQRRTRYNPEPRAQADNFAILGEDIQVASGTRLGQGTSAATAVTAGLAARILDFVRQKDVASGIDGVELLKTKAGMTAVFKWLSMSQGLYECIKPSKLLKDRKYNPKERTAFRKYAKENLVTALKDVE